ncbi:MAG: adenylate/guanylate cyclase domain-containing protein [Rhodospirillum sp.]|nr:adenylate/guanylate cyclase domain-containing protein [Rhodospirillum sp.]MCF8488763.1 adenylate/guanylate cyclase domain-containing protein [Rhodospirillum sp.]MCF8499715.1 adenylate/guanylate cyclase domain-containing protein [Rhodospirillum sp.]
MVRRCVTFLLGPGTEDRLPERVRTSIMAQQWQSEGLIAWVQLAILTFFALFYAISPKTAPEDSVALVPIVLSLHALFSLLRLVWVRRSMPPAWFVFLSVAADMALLMGLIWSFHIQYGQSAPFYLKAPTLLYVFIFIALRTLRFQPIYVAVAGLTAAAGWGGLLVYALGYGNMAIGGDRVTHDYIHYMTSNTILIGAEVDKIVSILVVTALLVLAQARSRRAMERAVAEGAAVRELSRFVSADILHRVRSSEATFRPGDAVERVASILFTDIEGYSTLSERVTPTHLLEILNGYFAVMGEICDRHGGSIAMFVGDAMMVIFDGPDHAARALATAVEIRATNGVRPLCRDGTTVMTRCGVNTGSMTLGTVGSKDRLIQTAHGDEVNVAARLEALNKDLDTYLLLTRATAEAAGLLSLCDPMGEVTVRGRAKSTAIFTLPEREIPVDPGLGAREGSDPAKGVRFPPMAVPGQRHENRP